MSPTLRGIAAVSLAAAVGCDKPEPTLRRTDASNPTATSWIAIERSDTLQWFLDSATVLRSPGRIYAWVAAVELDSTEAVPMNDPYHRFETWQELDCRDQLARGLDIRTPDSSGRTYVTPVRDSSWKEFAEHSLPVTVLSAVCTRLNGSSS